MNLPLQTLFVWIPPDVEFDYLRFFPALAALLQPEDILAVGSYEPGDEAFEWLSQNAISAAMPKWYGDSWKWNLDEYPRGRTFCLPPTTEILQGLAIRHARSGVLDSETGEMVFPEPDHPRFIDHVVCFRPGKPAIPLLNFHDAFSGGCLQLSGIYDEREIEDFSAALDVKLKYVWSDEYEFCIRPEHFAHPPGYDFRGGESQQSAAQTS